jgi:hypothetical protein
MDDLDLDVIRCAVREEIAPMRDWLAAIGQKFAGWSNLNFLQASAEQQKTETIAMREFRRYTEIKLNEIHGAMPTSGEITRLRDEVADITERERDLQLRVTAIELRLGLKRPD